MIGQKAKNAQKRLILPTKQSTDGQKPSRIKVPHALFVVASILGMLGVLSHPTGVRAGLFSPSTANAEGNFPGETSTQKIRLIEARVSPFSIGGRDVILDESALVPTTFSNISITNEGQKIAPIEEDVPEAPGEISTYVVKRGDTVSFIADKFDVSVNTILWANNMKKTDALKQGESLVILPITGIRYKVKSGDTASSIARRFKSDENDILSYNSITAKELRVGDEIIIPDGVAEVVAKAPVKKTVPVAVQETAVEVATIVPTTAAVVTPDGTLALHSSATFIRPVASGIGRISQGRHDGNAIDLAAPLGTPIHAVERGKVIVARPSGYNGGFGQYVVIQHENDVQTLYAHMSKVLVSVGDEVTQGQTIGLIGSTGRSTGPHVHYDVRKATNNCLKSCGPVK